MNGIKKAECFGNIKETDFYNSELNPYKLPPKSNFNIGAFSKYLAETGKNIHSLTKNEVDQFFLV